MCIFRLPAFLPVHLNAFRGNVLDISLRFRFHPFSTLVRPRCAVSLLLTSSRFSSRQASRLILSPSRSSPCISPRSVSSRLPCRSVVPWPLSSPRLPCRGARCVAERVVAICCVSYPITDIRCVLSICSSRTVCRVAVRGDRRGGRVLPMPSTCLCGFSAARQSVYILLGNRLIYRHRKATHGMAIGAGSDDFGFRFR